MIEQPTSHPDPAQLEAARRRIQDFLAELKSLAKTETDQKQFLNQLLARTLETTAASGAIIWQHDAEHGLKKLAELGSTISEMELQPGDFESHERVVLTAISKTQGITFEPNTRAAGDSSLVNATPYLLLIHPLGELVAGRRYAIELFQRPDINEAARTGYLRFLNEVGEVFLGWCARSELRKRQADDEKSQRVLAFIRDVHGSLNPREISYIAANDGRTIFDCDRMSVLSFNSRRTRALAVSGQDDIDNRSNVIQKQQRLASLVCRGGQTLWLAGQSETLPRGLQRAVDDYQNEAHARTLAIIPLFPASHSDAETEAATDTSDRVGEPIGAMVLEWFTLDVPRHERRYELDVVADNLARALYNAQSHHSIFLLPLWKLIGKWKWLVRARTLPRTVTALVAILILAALLVFYPYPFDVRVDGQLQPVDQHNVYANVDGVIKNVLIHHGQEVAQGELLLELENDDLELKLASAKGQLAEIDQDIRTTEAAALMTNDSGDREGTDEAEMRLERLRQRQDSLRRDVELLNQMAEKLKIYSPIDGTVVSWDPQRQLSDRPVSRQDLVLVIADVGSQWEMELYIPERKYGHVQRADDQPEITFFAVTDPQHKFRGKISSMEGHASEHQNFGTSVRAVAEFDQDTAPELYVGAAVTAKIHCGTSSVGYAWFHELLEFVQSRLLF